MSTMEIKVNTLSSPTMSRLKLNNAIMTVSAPESIEKPKLTAADGIITGTRAYSGEDDKEIFGSIKEHVVSFSKDSNLLVAEYKISSDSTADAMLIDVADNTSATVVVNYTSSVRKGCGFGGFKFRTKLGKNSSLHIVQLSILPDGTLYTNIQGDCGDDSMLKLTTVCLCASKAYIGADCRLSGKNSSFDSETAYILGEGELLDMNYNCDHIGKRTHSLIKASGVMKAESMKNSRQTINFIKGCAGSIGAESEDVLLLDDDIVNKSLPVILCTEEDVEGEHGASIGQPDEEIVYYLMSRGLDEQRILDMLRAAKIQSAASRISHKPTLELIENYLGISEE